MYLTKKESFMENILEVSHAPIIIFLVYWIINLLKSATNNNEKFLRFIPLLAAGLGVALSVVIYYTIPSIIVADNVLYAIIIGLSSGLAATGTNQIFKQLSKPNTISVQDKK
jgi:flagellar biosynthesis protein FliQ